VRAARSRIRCCYRHAVLRRLEPVHCGRPGGQALPRPCRGRHLKRASRLVLRHGQLGRGRGPTEPDDPGRPVGRPVIDDAHRAVEAERYPRRARGDGHPRRWRGRWRPQRRRRRDPGAQQPAEPGRRSGSDAHVHRPALRQGGDGHEARALACQRERPAITGRANAGHLGPDAAQVHLDERLSR